jgi:hypothetical protein
MRPKWANIYVLSTIKFMLYCPRGFTDTLPYLQCFFLDVLPPCLLPSLSTKKQHDYNLLTVQLLYNQAPIVFIINILTHHMQCAET